MKKLCLVLLVASLSITAMDDDLSSYESDSSEECPLQTRLYFYQECANHIKANLIFLNQEVDSAHIVRDLETITLLCNQLDELAAKEANSQKIEELAPHFIKLERLYT